MFMVFLNGRWVQVSPFRGAKTTVQLALQRDTGSGGYWVDGKKAESLGRGPPPLPFNKELRGHGSFNLLGTNFGEDEVTFWKAWGSLGVWGFDPQTSPFQVIVTHHHTSLWIVASAQQCLICLICLCMFDIYFPRQTNLFGWCLSLTTPRGARAS